MTEITSIINILTYSLPGNVTRPIYQEYNSRRKEIDRIWADPKNKYKMLQDYVPTIETLLALSLFYRHVLGHLQGATSFYKYVNQRSGLEKECAIKIGKTILDYDQQRHIFSAIITFNRLQKKYQLDSIFFEFAETIQFMRNCRDLYYQEEYEEDDTV